MKNVLKRLLAGAGVPVDSGARLRTLERQVASLTATVEELRAAIARREGDLPPAPKPASAAKPAVAAKPAGAAKPATGPKPAGAGLPIAIVGTGGHGRKHIAAFAKLKDCRIATICDVDSAIGEAAADHVATLTGRRPKVVQDIRRVLEDKEIVAVAIATPHHWHALATVWALQAGKHVYVEKPITHSVWEGPSVLAAARKYGKVVQSGTQLRSNASLAAAGEYMREGRLGDVGLVHCIIHKDRPPVPLTNQDSIPASVDFDLWCGPADKGPVTRAKFHYHWHWLWAFGNGALGNNGIHRIDAARIALDLKGYGDLVVSCGGRFGPRDSGETPNNQLALHRFGNTWVLQDVLGLNPKPFRKIQNGVLFYGSLGTIVYKAGAATLVDDNGAVLHRFPGEQQNHYQNFLDAVKANDPGKLRGELAEGILSSDLCHLGNISQRIGEEADDATIAATVREIGAPEFVQTRLAALRANLVDNGIGDARITLGQTLRLRNGQDPIVDNPRASAYLRGSYREPFVLPAPEAV